MNQQTANPAAALDAVSRAYGQGPARTWLAHATEAFVAIVAMTVIVAAGALVLFAATHASLPSVRFTGASLTVQFAPRPPDASPLAPRSPRG